MYRNILVPIDLDQPASWQDALAAVVPLARCMEAEVTICSVVSDINSLRAGEWLPICVRQSLDEARARLNGLVAGADAERKWSVEVAAGTVSGGILEIAERMAADLIVLVSDKPKTRDFLSGSKAVRVARRASCSVLVARPGRG